MRVSVGEMAALSGVSVRTLHYYDQIGLLRPCEVSVESGYRWYGEAEVRRLQRILFYRELDFPLKKIVAILSEPDYDAREALRGQRELLRLKRQRLDRLLALLDDNLKGERTMDFSGFDTKELDEARAAYADEAQKRWGGTSAWQEFQRRGKGRTKEEQDGLDEQANGFFRRFAALRGGDPASAEAHSAVEGWQAFLTENYYPCTEEVLSGLGKLYLCDERFRTNLDRFGDGTAEWISAAIAAYCGE
jgi:DNA-binding transcriptional MerR regulator